MSADPTTPADLGIEPTFSARESAAMLGRSFGWIDQRVRAGEFVLPDGRSVQPFRTPGGYRRFTLGMLRDIVAASAHRGWFATEEIRNALRVIIIASQRETGEYKIPKSGTFVH